MELLQLVKSELKEACSAFQHKLMKQKSGQEIWNDPSLIASRWRSEVRRGAEQSDSTSCFQKNQISEIKFVCEGQTWCCGVLQPLLHAYFLALMSRTQAWFIIFFILWSWAWWNIHALPPRSHTLNTIHMQNEPSWRWRPSAGTSGTCVNVVWVSLWESVAIISLCVTLWSAPQLPPGVLIFQPNCNGPPAVSWTAAPVLIIPPPPPFFSHLSSAIIPLTAASGYPDTVLQSEIEVRLILVSPH